MADNIWILTLNNNTSFESEKRVIIGVYWSKVRIKDQSWRDAENDQILVYQVSLVGQTPETVGVRYK